MTEKEILSKFIDLEVQANKEWLELIRKSISFTPKEKALFIIDYNKYNTHQIEKFLLALQKSAKREEVLEHNHPDEYKKRVGWFEKGWSNMIDYLAEVLTEQQSKDSEIMDNEEIDKLRKEIEKNF